MKRVEGRLIAGEEISWNRASRVRAIESATEDREPEALRKRGALYLSLGETSQAVQHLEEAAFLMSGEARLLSDLSAAYLTRARDRKDPFDLILALSATDRALHVLPSLPEARFNHALALEKLHLRDAASHSWAAYLELDKTSAWAREARARQAALAEPSAAERWEDQRATLDLMDGGEEEIDRIAARFPLEARQHVEDTLLGVWADAVSQGKEREAIGSLAVARTISAALAARYGEWMPADAVAAIDSSAGYPARRAALVDGHLTYRDARKLHGSMRVSEARPLFERARQAFSQGRSPAESLADLYLAVGQYQHSLYAPALATLRRLAGEERSRRSPGLLARVHWTLGLVLMVNGRPADAVDAYRKSLAAASKVGALEDVAGAHAVLAESFRYLGQPTKTWRHLHEGLSLTPSIGTSRRLAAILFETAEACSAAGEPAAERYFREESVRVTRKAGEPTSLANALLHRAWTLHRLGDPAGAEKDLEEARWIAEMVRDEPQQLRLQAYLLMVESEIDILRNPGEAERALTWALDFFAEKQNHYFLSRLYLARARTELVLGEENRAEDDLQRGIEEFELQRRSVKDEPLRISFFDQSDSLFDEMVRLQSRRPRGVEKALDYAERERARALLDRLRPLTARQRTAVVEGTLAPWTAREIQRALPGDVALVEYAVLKDQLLAWVLRDDGIAFKQTQVQTRTLDGLVKRLRASLSGGPPGHVAPSATALYDLLVRPVLPWLQDKRRVVFVPDGSLNAVPFAALLDRTSGRFLLQDRILAVAPSATFYIKALERDRALTPHGRITALLVANPRSSREVAFGLPELPEAESEAQEIAARFPGSEVLSKDRATRNAFFAAAVQHEIIHFGGHAVVNRDFPLLSYLLMAPGDGEDSGLLYAHELYGTRFVPTRLAVLAACSTADGPIHSEGPVSLARAFLAVGIPGVVASLWDVDDMETSQLLRIFYDRLQQGNDAAAALRDAQLTLLSDTDSDRTADTWAAFEVIGVSSGHRNQER